MSKLIQNRLQATVLLVWICAYSPLTGQITPYQEFVFEAFKSVMYIDSYRTTHDTIIESYLTFHPVSISNDTVSMYLSSITIKSNGKKVIERGRIRHIPKSILPTTPLQLLVQPIVVYFNGMRTSIEMGKDLDDRFTDKDLDIWAACGYQVQVPTSFGLSTHY